jgi:hypothetical protein
MTEIMTADICLNAFTVAASAVADAMSKSKKLRHRLANTIPMDPMAHDHKDNAQSAEPDLPRLVSMNDVRTDGGTQARMAINESVVKDYAEALEEGAKLPPVVLYYEHDADVYWLADGFHRFEAHRVIGRVAISAFVKDGTQRDAKLHAAGANGTHGLPRTNADKRCAVLMLLEDPEWATWSDNAIAKACGVSHTFVGNVRASLESVASEARTERTYTTKHGTTATMHTTKVGKSKPTAPLTPSDAKALPIGTDPGIAAACLEIEQGAVAVARLDELLAENATVREEVVDLKAVLAETLADNELLHRVVDADDQVKAAVAEAARYRAVAEQVERTLAEQSNEFCERAREVIYWKKRAEKAEKRLAKIEATSESSALLAEQFQETLVEADTIHKVIEADDRLAEATKLLRQTQELNRVLQTRVQGLTSAERDALRTENCHLRAQLGDLALQLGEAMVCHDEVCAALNTTVPLDEVPRQLQRALELALTCESRVAEAPHRHVEAQCEQADVAQYTGDEMAMYDEHVIEQTKTELLEYQPFAANSMTQSVARGERGNRPDAATVPEED